MLLKLTQLGGKPVAVSTATVMMIYPRERGCDIHIAGDRLSPLTVRESLDDILRLEAETASALLTAPPLVTT